MKKTGNQPPTVHLTRDLREHGQLAIEALRDGPGRRRPSICIAPPSIGWAKVCARPIDRVLPAIWRQSGRAYPLHSAGRSALVIITTRQKILE